MGIAVAEMKQRVSQAVVSHPCGADLDFDRSSSRIEVFLCRESDRQPGPQKESLLAVHRRRKIAKDASLGLAYRLGGGGQCQFYGPGRRGCHHEDGNNK